MVNNHHVHIPKFDFHDIITANNRKLLCIKMDI